MIRLTTIVGEPFLLNAELIRTVEQRPDTFITLTTGERLIVSETMDEVMRRVIDYQRSKHLLPSFDAPRPRANPAATARTNQSASGESSRSAFSGRPHAVADATTASAVAAIATPPSDGESHARCASRS